LGSKLVKNDWSKMILICLAFRESGTKIRDIGLGNFGVELLVRTVSRYWY
jgi:hypothetical protein